MKEFSTTTVIDAPAEVIWSILLEVGAYPEFDPFCERVEGAVALGAKLKVYSKLSPGRAFALVVKALEPNARMVWQGGMPLGLFKGVRTFSIADRADGRCTFTMHEVFSGPMLPLIAKSLPDMTEAFDAFAAGLRRRAEAAARRAA